MNIGKFQYLSHSSPVQLHASKFNESLILVIKTKLTNNTKITINNFFITFPPMNSKFLIIYSDV